MAECSISEGNGYKKIKIKGRIDSISAPSVENEIQEISAGGAKIIACDFSEVNYISSAGLRIFLTGKQRMANAGGDLILFGMNDQIYQVFKMGGFHNILKILPTEEDIIALNGKEKIDIKEDSREIGNIHFEYQLSEKPPQDLNIYGSQSKLSASDYSEEDIVSVNSNDLDYGTGLAATGVNYDDFKHYFGEATVLKSSMFFYPAVKKTAVDFMLANPEMNMEYKFFHGFGFKSSPIIKTKFTGTEGFVALDDLVNAILELTQKDLIGIAFISESKGIWGMNLRKVPIKENKPDDIENIFDQDHFSEWMNFPVEPSDANNIIIATGIAAKDKSKLSSEINQLFPKENNFHMHGVVFGKELFNDDLEKFDEEIQRIITTSEASKVKHLLARSRFYNGIAIITELKG
mgnify:CR=1 FL=1